MNRKERTILVTIIINLALVGLKGWLSYASGSLAMEASAWHTFADVFVGGFMLVGIFLTRWESETTRKSGLSLIENVVAMVVAVAILYAGLNIFLGVVGGEIVELHNLGWVTATSLVTVAVAWFVARYLRYVGQQTNSQALLAGAYHAQLHIWEALVVAAGLAGSLLGLQNLDRLAAVLVVLFVIFAGFEILSGALTALRQRQVLHLHATPQHVGHGLIGRAFMPTVVIVLVGLYLLSGFYVVRWNEQGVVRRFGQIIATQVPPGLHYRLPWPVDQASMVDVATVRRTETPSTLALTGDESLINVQVAVHYRITDPAAYLFTLSDPEAAITDAAQAAIRQIAAQETVDALLTTDKALIQNEAAVLTQSALDNYGAGLQVLNVQLLQSSPPEAVADAFRDVASAREDKNTFINEALAYQNETIPVARGEAEKAVQAAKAYQASKVAASTGEANRFASRLAAYQDGPEVTRTRLYLEAVEQVLPGLKKFLVDPAIQLTGTDLWFTNEAGPQPFVPGP
jgi:membrane protease subunit HflK